MLGSKCISLIIFFVVCFFVSNKDNEWKLKKSSDGISVYSRVVTNSSFKELKSVSQIKTSLSSIIALLEDRKAFPEWVYRCGKSSIIKNISASESVCYQNVQAPWPVDNRDIVMHIKTRQDPKTKVVIQTGEGIPNFIPEVNGCVRVIVFTAKWILTPLKNGIVNIEYELMVDPAGNVPAWLVNLAAVDGPYETAFNLRTMVLKEKYQKAKFDFITEPIDF